MFKTFDISPNGLQFDDVFIERPFYVSPSQWITWGEWVRDYDPRVEVYSAGEFENLEETNSNLERQVGELEDKIYDLERDICVKDLEIQKLDDRVAELQAIVDGRLVE